ncbi:hypothetical protein PR048_013726 [Dryococelus australis]|uniref:Uncharacterized protein n=1 Tax=Dryococelus australis TaxID=614101 RepID=A0ABQ9HTU0_9NEOP|nr:hypothetical protein PR048_013726 [Dryococelus australis]
MNNLFAYSCKIVSHFKHSSASTKILKKIKKIKTLLVLLCIVKLLQEQYVAVILSAGEISLPDTLTNSQWNMIDHVIPLLAVFVAFQVSSLDVSASEILCSYRHCTKFSYCVAAGTAPFSFNIVNDLGLLVFTVIFSLVIHLVHLIQHELEKPTPPGSGLPRANQ